MVVSESFLHYLWQYQYFRKSGLRSTEGEEVIVFHPGIHNHDAGPDFSQSRLRIGNLDWTGNVEIHFRSSEWHAHRHDQDPAYDNVVLHVVWQDDRPVYARDNSRVPTLELKERVDESLVAKYKKVVLQPDDIPCRRSFSLVSNIVKMSMLDRVLVSRLERKTEPLRSDLQHAKGDWEEVAYRALARNFGFNMNQDAFGQLGRILPCRILQKHLNQRNQVEALAYGMAGFLDKQSGDSYYTSLKQEFGFLASKYRFTPDRMKRSQWKFLRLRPGNFPTVRIAQWTALMYSGRSLLSSFIEPESVKELRAGLQAPLSEYWNTHYDFGKESSQTSHVLGESSADLIVINTVVPLLAFYGLYHQDQAWVDKAEKLLHELPAENNAITRRWISMKMTMNSAFDSQASVELYQNFCKRKSCLHCAVGASLIKPDR